MHPKSLFVKENVAASAPKLTLSALLFLLREQISTRGAPSRLSFSQRFAHRIHHFEKMLCDNASCPRLPPRLAGNGKPVLPHHHEGIPGLRHARNARSYGRHGPAPYPDRGTPQLTSAAISRVRSYNGVGGAVGTHGAQVILWGFMRLTSARATSARQVGLPDQDRSHQRPQNLVVRKRPD